MKLNQNENIIHPTQTFSKSRTKMTIEDHLTTLGKDELIALIVNLSKEYEEVEQALTLKFTDASQKDSLNQFKKVIRTSIRQYSDRHGFVSYRNVPYAVAGAEQILKKAEDVLARGNSLRAAEISFCVMHEMLKLLQSCDDSGGNVGWIIKEILNLIHRASVQLENSSSKDRSMLFHLLLKEVTHSSIEGWDEWQLSLLESAIYVMATDEEKNLWCHLIEKLEAHEENQSGYGSFFSENAALLRHQVIQKFEGDEEALKFLQDHLDITAFRKMAIEDAMKHRDFDRALELAEQGELKDSAKRYHGLVDQWKEYRYEIYCLTHQVEKQIILAEDFALSGDYPYYVRLKELYSETEWPAAYEELLDKLEASSKWNWRAASLYTRVLIEEKETDRLMDYVRKNDRTVLELYPHIIDKYPEEVFRLFTQIILEATAESSDRKGYKKVCGIIREMIKAGGADQAKEIIHELGNTYSKRPALLDELGKIKLK